MINPGVLLEALVAALRGIAELVQEMDGDVERIRGHYDAYPTQASLARAVYDMKAPGILVAYRGYGYQTGRYGSAWMHSFSIFAKCRRTNPGDPAGTQHRALQLLVEGVPAGSGKRLLDTEVHDSCLSMELPVCTRQTQVIDALGNMQDYWEFKTAFPEKSDT